MTYSGLEIKKIRDDLGLNQKDFAKKLGVSAKTISEWENDERPVSKVKHLNMLTDLKNRGHNTKKIKSINLSEFMAVKEIGQKELVVICGLSQPMISEVINNNRFLKEEYITKIREKYPEIDDYIIYEGDQKADSKNLNELNNMRKVIQAQQETIASLKDQIALLKEKIQILERDNFFSKESISETD